MKDMSLSRIKTLALATRLRLNIELTTRLVIYILYVLVSYSKRPVLSEYT